MGLELTVNHPDFPKGHEFTINGLGVFPNGESVRIDEEQEQAFASNRHMTVRDAFADSPTVEVKGSSSQKVDVPEPPSTEAPEQTMEGGEE